MGAAIGVHHGPVIAGSDGLDGGVQHRVDELGVRARADRPADDQAIEAIDHGRQVHLAGRDLELRDVGEPLLVRCTRAEVAVQEVVWCRTDLAHVRAVSPAFARGGDQALLLHQAPHDLLRDGHALPGQRGLHPAVAVATIVALEDVGHDASNVGVLVADLEPRPMVEVGAAWQAHFAKQLGQRVRRSQGINQLGLLPIRQELPVDAQLFF